jgi:ABC-type multidrug transport system fused ATPase/permease subunit
VSVTADDVPRQSTAVLLARLLGRRRTAVATLVVISVVAGINEAGILAVVATAAAALVNGGHRVHVSLASVSLNVRYGTLMLIGFAMALLRLGLQIPLSTLPARIMVDVEASLQGELFAAYSNAAWGEQARDREGHLNELVGNQALQAAVGTLSVTGLVTATITLAVLVVSALVLNALAAAVVLATVVIMFIGLRPLTELGVRQVRRLGGVRLDFANRLLEAARLAEEAHVFGVEEAQRHRVQTFIESLQTLNYRAQVAARIGPSIYQSCIYLIVLGGLAVIGATDSTHVGSLGAVILLLLRSGSYGQQVQSNYQAARQTLPYLERVDATRSRYLDSTPVRGSRSLGKVTKLSFEGVSYSYVPGTPVLSDVSFSVRGGEAIGIVGPSGTGKSTLVQLLLRLREPDDGRYLVNNLPASEFTEDSWHTKVAYVPQEPRLLHDTVAENIRFFRALGDAEVERAARLARIHDEIMSWSDGYETIIGPRADAVSGGQQQRICIARALVAKPTVLVLDEPTSALDPASEQLLQESLEGLREHLTLFVVAHRMSTLDICDRVMVILGGRLDAFAAASELREHSNYYRAALQTSGMGAA